MKSKSMFWSFVNKVVTHNNFKDVFRREFPTVQNPSLDGALHQALSHSLDGDYADLDKCANANDRFPIFVTARFRSGSTLLWNILRQVEGLHCYYEPLNERTWFDKENRQESTDSSHKGVDNYWSEYDHISGVGSLFSRDWTYKRLLMDAGCFDARLHGYIDALVAQSPVRPVLQFNRIDFRLPWLRSNFRSAKVIHLYRHPRDQWVSVSRYSIPVSHDLSGHDLSTYNIFYTVEWARDLAASFPFLDPSLGKHPYYYHYLLWRLSYIYGRAYSDLSVSYESLVTDAAPALSSMFDVLGITGFDMSALTSVIDERPDLGKWKRYAGGEWFQAIERECETLLRNYFNRG